MFIHRLTQGATKIDVMKINVNAVHFTADQKLITFINEKVNCNIYNFKIYNRELSASEVLQNYNAVKSRFGLS
jgi:hypothetical protein